MALFEPHNLLIRSEELITSWATNGTVSISSNVSPSPMKDTSAESVNFVTDSASIGQTANLGFSTTSVSMYTFSIYARCTTISDVILSISTNLSDVSTRTVRVTTKWVRFSVSVSARVGTSSITCKVQDVSNGSGSIFDLWGAQLNSGGIQPYYKTTSSPYKGNSIAYTPVPMVGDLTINSAHKTVVEWDEGNSVKSPYRTEFATTTKVSTAGFGSIVLGGVDLESRINKISLTSGLGDSNITNGVIASNSVNLDKFGVMSISKGGTNSTVFGKDEVVFSAGSKLVSTPDLKIESNGVGISSNITVDFVGNPNVFTLTSGLQGLILSSTVSGKPSVNLTNNVGTPPTIINMTLSGLNVTYNVDDKDGDLRSIHVIWSSTQAKPVITSPSQITMYTLNPSFSTSIERTEIDLVRYPTTGSSSRSGVFALTGSPVWVYAVVEDGPGNFSSIRSFP